MTSTSLSFPRCDCRDARHRTHILSAIDNAGLHCFTTILPSHSFYLRKTAITIIAYRCKGKVNFPPLVCISLRVCRFTTNSSVSRPITYRVIFFLSNAKIKSFILGRDKPPMNFEQKKTIVTFLSNLIKQKWHYLKLK